ncbi:MAG: amidohydrolase [Firmicutes bacterium]|nr:amidohydrolase [Bacillota bacterium]
MKDLVKKLASEQKEAIRENRHHLHMHPELSFEEFETSAWIKEHLVALGIPTMEGISGTSVVGILKGFQPGPTIAFRADIDALPVQEDNDLEYKSCVDGVMHACGHDTHNATLMSFAAIMAAHPELVKGTIKFIFQAAEEKLPGGAVQLVKEGVMDDVDMIFGFHCAAGLELGKTIVNDGPLSAAVATYEVKITGKGGHGSDPSRVVNPVPIAIMAANAVNQIKPEKVAPLHPITVTVSYIHGGKYPNVLPGDAMFGGHIRALYNEDVKMVMDNIQKITTAIVESWGASCEYDIIYGYPANVNDKEQADIVRAAVRELGYETLTREPGLGGEDFAYYALEKPSCFFSVGGANPDDPKTYFPHHSKDFKLDEDMLDIALECEIGTYLKATGQA